MLILTPDNPTWLATAAIAALASVITSALSALIAVPIALRRFRAERIWDRKSKAYGDVNRGAMFHMRTFAQRAIDQLETTQQVDSEVLAPLSKRASRGRAALRRAAAFGTVLLCEAAAKRLDELVDALDEPVYDLNVLEEFESEVEAIDAALKDMREFAQTDLDLK